MRLKVIALLALAVVGLLGVVILAGCAQADSEAARRANAEAALVRAEGQAYAERRAADAQLAAEQANIRQMERDAAHQRAMEVLPVLVILVGALLVAVLAGLIFWDLRRQAIASDPRLLILLERHERRLAQLERVAWHELPAGDDRQVIVYEDRSRRP